MLERCECLIAKSSSLPVQTYSPAAFSVWMIKKTHSLSLSVFFVGMSLLSDLLFPSAGKETQTSSIAEAFSSAEARYGIALCERRWISCDVLIQPVVSRTASKYSIIYLLSGPC